MNAQAPQLDDPERPRAAIKFTYASGARPLEGYTIKRGVGRGGFGEVYFATSDAGKEVALKLIRRNLDVELRGVTQCLNLKHPNLIALYDIRTDEMGDQWVVMEYVSGASLEDTIERHPNGVPIDEVLYWMRGMCAGVAYLHDHGIVHRDLKPGNIFSDEGTVKIGDYGLAKFISCSRRSGQTESVGTVHYMAPEIANGRYGREIDTYALGIILFEMLTGHVPFEGESVGEVLMKHLTAEPDLSVLQEPYRDIVKRALAKDPNVRIKSVGELVALLPGAGDPAPNFARFEDHSQPQPQFASASSDAPRAAAGGPNVKFRAQFKTAFNREAHAAHDKVEEPIWKAIRGAGAYTRRRWYGDGMQPMSGGQKAALVIAVIIFVKWLSAAFAYQSNMVGLFVQLLIIYGIYYAVWATLIRPAQMRNQTTNRQPRPGEAASAVGRPTPYAAPADPNQTAHYAAVVDPNDLIAKRATQAQLRRRSRTNWRARVQQQLATKPLREKLTELLGSMILAAIFSAVAACGVMLFTSNQPTSEITATYSWIALVGTLGSWAVMIPAKFAEGKLEDQVPMRLTLMLLGAVLGIAAWYIADSFMLKMPAGHEPVDVRSGLISHEMLRWSKVTGDMNPPVAIYTSYFAFLFLLPRWWRLSEFTRTTRMSLWSIVCCVFAAWLLHIFWWFPQPFGLVAAAVIALSTQLASPWMPPSQRRAISESPEQAVS